MKVDLFKYDIDFKDKRKLRRSMIAESEEEVKEYIKNKHKTNEFTVVRDKLIGTKIK